MSGSNETRRKRLARALAAAEQLGYQEARRRVDAAARAGVLPPRFDRENQDQALQVLRDRGGTEHRTVDQLLATARARPLERRAPGLLRVEDAGATILDFPEHLLVAYANGAADQWGYFTDLASDVAQLPRGDRVQVGYRMVTVFFALLHNFVEAHRTHGASTTGDAALAHDVLDGAISRCSPALARALRAAVTEPRRSARLSGTLEEDVAAVMVELFTAADPEYRLVFEACDAYLGEPSSWSQIAGRAAGADRSCAWLWLNLTAELVIRLLYEVAERDQHDPLQTLDELFAPEEHRRRFDDVERYTPDWDVAAGAAQAVRVLRATLLNGEPWAVFDPLLADIEAAERPLSRRAELLAGFAAVSSLAATAVEIDGRHGRGPAAVNDRLEQFVAAVRTYAADGPATSAAAAEAAESAYALLLADPQDPVSYLAAAGGGAWAVMALSLLMVAVEGTEVLAHTCDVDPLAWLDSVAAAG